MSAHGTIKLRHALQLLAGIAVAAATGCGTTGPKFDPRAEFSADLPPGFVTTGTTNRLKPEWLKPSTDAFRIGPGDRIEIEILGKTGTRAATFVGPDGKIYYDLLPAVDVWGLSLMETKELLERELAAYYKRPQVVVNLLAVESKCVWVLGRLNRSGVFPLSHPTTVLEAVANAGGLYAARFSGTTDELADLNHSFLIRNGEMLPVDFNRLLRQGDMSHNVYLQADDFIYLPSSLSKEVQVLGAVNRPAPVGFKENLTLVSVIGAALGTQPAAYLSHVAIVRGSLAEPKIAIVNLKAILTGQARDIRMEPRDIVYVPFSPYTTLEKYAKMVTDCFVRTVAANEGGHAGARSFQGLGVSNPLP